MNKLKLISAFIAIFMLFIPTACSDDDDTQSTSVDPTPVINTINNGTWRITLYNDSGTVETTNFTGYNFTFGPSSVLTAINGSTTVTGTWSVTSDNSGDDSPSNDLDFNIAFATPANFAELTDDWNIISYTSTKIELIHVSGGGGGTDYLTFEKN
ncbi:hypothetical protein [Flavobacterium urocaniciphilum]|uniref:Lipocalin-like domain-containing protein n=1 Tax=Flavobacterium urocaniciphilum TaxID=1299341 RepID=A0A1H9B3C2_9FLAO|nr:hypothetical protein [Flavobacterium urocaniciphilum]SEP82708.1 hypothetical protein SAMN05444005_102448 [Flavobacterium urocaniciphilum]